MNNEQKSMHTWHWQTWDNLPYLTCSLLKSWRHGFFTSAFSPRTPDQIVEALQPEANVYRVRQVHGNTVLTPSEIVGSVSQEETQTPEKPAADGIFTEHPQEAVWVCTADCTPVLIGDEQTGRVAAIHAGWRGTAARIVPHTIARFLETGSRLDNLRIAMGPAIAGEVYQVSETVALEVVSSIIPTDKTNPESILQQLQQLTYPPVFDDPHPGRVRLDVRRVNAIQLEQLGLHDEQVAIAPHCTYQQPEYFFSYRRTQQKKVQWSGIVSK